jgi:hypothetical protein
MNSHDLRSTNKPTQLKEKNQEADIAKFFDAVRSGFLREIQHILDKTDIDINTIDNEGNSVLFYALKNKMIITANFLIDREAKVIAKQMNLPVDFTGVNLWNVDLTGFNLAGGKINNLQITSIAKKWFKIDESANLTRTQRNSTILLGLWQGYHLCLDKNLFTAEKIKNLIDAINLEKNISLSQIRQEWQFIRNIRHLELLAHTDSRAIYDQDIFNLINVFLNQFKEYVPSVHNDYVSKYNLKRPYLDTNVTTFKRRRTENSEIPEEQDRYAQWSPKF